MLRNNGLGRAIRAALVVVVTFVTGTAQAGVILDWQFFESEAQLGQSGVIALSDKMETVWGSEPNASAMADVESSLGETIAELQGSQSVDGTGVWTINLTSALDLRVNEDSGGVINFSRGKTYFQLAVVVSDQPYQFDLDYDIDDAGGPFVTQYDHFVATYGSGSILYPREDPYILLWGGLDYAVTSFAVGGWDYLSAHASTKLTLELVPVPEPATVSLLLLGGLSLLRRRSHK
ncbi:MAG: PEP-CTERM sorting domain-containing protein [Phycisphaerales bacterium]|nr:PEP-CTERM sorting domain-containing protein [Phycisphaerales bacterium]